MAARWGRKAALPMFALSNVLRVYPAIQQVTYAAGFTADDNSTVSTAASGAELAGTASAPPGG
jgi:hypothetical protein